MNISSEKECSSETAQFLTAPTSESDTNVRSMIVYQVLVMKVGTFPLLLSSSEVFLLFITGHVWKRCDTVVRFANGCWLVC